MENQETQPVVTTDWARVVAYAAFTALAVVVVASILRRVRESRELPPEISPKTAPVPPPPIEVPVPPIEPPAAS